MEYLRILIELLHGFYELAIDLLQRVKEVLEEIGPLLFEVFILGVPFFLILWVIYEFTDIFLPGVGIITTTVLALLCTLVFTLEVHRRKHQQATPVLDAKTNLSWSIKKGGVWLLSVALLTIFGIVTHRYNIYKKDIILIEQQNKQLDKNNSNQAIQINPEGAKQEPKNKNDKDGNSNPAESEIKPAPRKELLNPSTLFMSFNTLSGNYRKREAALISKKKEEVEWVLMLINKPSPEKDNITVKLSFRDTKSFNIQVTETAVVPIEGVDTVVPKEKWVPVRPIVECQASLSDYDWLKRLREELTLTETEFTLFTHSEEMDAEDKEVLEAARRHYRRKMRELYKEEK